MTVYIVVTVGVTATEKPVNPPGFHTYTLAPLATSVSEVPAQMVGEVALAVTVGTGLINSVNNVVEVHPKALAPVTV